MNKRRLLKLAHLLESDAKNKKGIKFNLGVLGFAAFDDDKNAKLDCGGSGCAMGLAAMSGAFKREGLSYKATGGLMNNIKTMLNGRSLLYDTAAMRLFDISRSQANFLFTPSFYPRNKLKGAIGERYVAKRIRDFVAGKVVP